MHIAIVAPEQIPVPPILGGSVEICILSIARKLALNRQVTIISRCHRNYPSITHHGNLTIIRVPAGNEKNYLRSVLKVIQSKRFDWIQVDNRPRIAASIKIQNPNTPVSLFLHSTTFVTPPHCHMSEANDHLTKVNLIICNSRSLKTKINQLFPQHRDKLRTVLLGVDAIRFRPPTREQQLEFRKKMQVEHTFNVLFVGRLIPKKGLPVLMKAMAQARIRRKNLRLIVIGGPQRKRYETYLRQMVRKLNIPVSFIGKRPHTQLHRTYWLGDCLVCPSQKHEAFGLVNVEAMASGIPVIASKNGGIQEIIKHGTNGFLVPQYQKARGFAKKIVMLANQPDLCKKLGQQARAAVIRQFSWQRVANELLQQYLNDKKESGMRKRGEG